MHRPNIKYQISKITLVLIIVLGGFLRFYNLNWGNGHHFHPDENNMARSISQLCLNVGSGASYKDPELGLNSESGCTLNPEFFAYGQFPLYLAYFSGIVAKTVGVAALSRAGTSFAPTVSFADAVLLLRIWSALVSTLTIPLVYLVTKQMFIKGKAFYEVKGLALNNSAPTIAAILVAFTPGLIQAAHFGTTESLLTFFFMLILYLSLMLPRKNTNGRYPIFTRVPERHACKGVDEWRTVQGSAPQRKPAIVSATGVNPWGTTIIIGLGLASGLALGTKLTAAYFLPTPLLALFIAKKKYRISNIKYLISAVAFLIIAVFFFILASPYNLLEFSEFMRISKYEADIATGKTQVFYTRQFIDTVPFIFQAKKVFLYALGFALFLLGTLGFLYTLISNIKYLISKLLITRYSLLITVFSFLAYLIPNSLLYAKWTRFMTPVFPFFAIFAAYLVTSLFQPAKKSTQQLIFPSFFLLIAIIPGVLFFNIYIRPDTRVAASEWIYRNIPANSYILSETANVVDIPITSGVLRSRSPDVNLLSYNVISFDFYHLDENPELQDELVDHLAKADYIFIPSRRIFANHLRLPDRYPLVVNYYKALFSGELGFRLAHTELPATCQWSIVNGQLCDEVAEETFTVFDHPVVRVYKKTREYNREEYGKILTFH